VWETFRYGTGAGDAELPRAEILAVAVDRPTEGRGYGRALVGAAVEELRARGVDAAHVVTAVGNTAAITMYGAAGFRVAGRTEVHRGVPQEVLVWP
jgi:ribosomal protein S18 acetylase RimI-like enzyme